MRLLIIDDDDGVASLLRRALAKQGYEVTVAQTGTQALKLAKQQHYDTIILDVVLEDLDGFEICARLREAKVWTPILMITGVRDSVEARVQGLDAGADDFISKPFHLAEIAARIRALTRRDVEPRPPRLVVGDLELDPATRVVTRAGRRIDLSGREFALLHLLMRRAGEVLSRDTILDRVWGFGYAGVSNVVDVYIRYLREKIDRPFGTASLVTVRGAGYRLAPPDGEASEAG